MGKDENTVMVLSVSVKRKVSPQQYETDEYGAFMEQRFDSVLTVDQANDWMKIASGQLNAHVHAQIIDVSYGGKVIAAPGSPGQLESTKDVNPLRPSGKETVDMHKQLGKLLGLKALPKEAWYGLKDLEKEYHTEHIDGIPVDALVKYFNIFNLWKLG